jgi:hypothetical protein
MGRALGLDCLESRALLDQDVILSGQAREHVLHLFLLSCQFFGEEGHVRVELCTSNVYLFQTGAPRAVVSCVKAVLEALKCIIGVVRRNAAQTKCIPNFLGGSSGRPEKSSKRKPSGQFSWKVVKNRVVRVDNAV